MEHKRLVAEIMDKAHDEKRAKVVVADMMAGVGPFAGIQSIDVLYISLSHANLGGSQKWFSITLPYPRVS